MPDLRNLYFHSDYANDKIIATFSGSFTAAATSGSRRVTTTSFSTGIAESTFFQGIYSVDGGVSWYRFNAGYGSDPISPEITVFGYSNASTFTLTANNDNLGTPTAYTVLYKLALIAKQDQGDIEVQENSLRSILFNTTENYLKIVSDNKQSLSLASTAATKVRYTHNLGYYPQALSYFQLTSGFDNFSTGLYELATLCPFDLGSNAPNEAGNAITTSGVYITTTEVVASLKNNSSSLDTFVGNLYIRIYGDD